jgi:cytochrome c553
MTDHLYRLTIAVVLLCASTASAQTARTGRLMREKLRHSQRLLQAVTTSDWALLQRETQALTAVTKSPTWMEIMRPELRPYGNEFQKTLADLAAAADRRDYDSSGRSYLALTGACLACHKHVMNARIARTLNE